MRILVVTNMFPTTAEPWFGSFVAEQMSDMRGLGVEMEMLSFDGRRQRSEYARAVACLRRLVRTGNFDLVHAHYGLSGAVACTQRRWPVVTTFHGSDTGYIRWQRAVSWCVARACTPICVSRQGAEMLRLRDPTVIPIGVDTASFGPVDRAAVRRHLGWARDTSYVLFPGSRRNRVKNVGLFDEVVRHASQRQPDLASVTLEGLSRAEVALAIAAADVTLMTSHSEGSPVTVKESLACGTPVVSVPVGDNAEVLRDLTGCAVVPRNVAALADAVLAAIAHGPDLLFRERAEQYSRAAIAERVLAVYVDTLRAA